MDGHIRDRVGRDYNDYRNQFTVIANRALDDIGVDYLGYVSDATNSYYNQLLGYMLYENPQIRHFRKLLSGEKDKLEKVEWVLPTTITVGALAVLSGALSDPTTGQVDHTWLGQYLVGGNLSVGTIYTGYKSLSKFSDEFFELTGLTPEIVYEWRHLRNFGVFFPPHVALDGKIITKENWQTVLLNVSTPWTGSAYHHPQEQVGCLCLLAPVLR